MKNAIVLLVHLLARLSILLGRGGTRAVLAGNILLKQQLLVLQRSRRRAPNLRTADRLLFGFCSQFLSPRRLLRTAIILKPATLLRFHRGFKDLKYRFLYSSRVKKKPGPNGSSLELIRGICELNRRNPRFGCPKIAQHLGKTSGIDIDKDVVRRVLAVHYRPERRDNGPSWLTRLGHTKDSLRSLDLFRTESILLRSYWVLVVLDQFSRRIVGFGVQAGAVDGPALCRRFNQAISSQGLPKRLSTDHDPLFRFHRWQANLRILEVETVQTEPVRCGKSSSRDVAVNAKSTSRNPRFCGELVVRVSLAPRPSVRRSKKFGHPGARVQLVSARARTFRSSKPSGRLLYRVVI
jgi:transposase InsO family protein